MTKRSWSIPKAQAVDPPRSVAQVDALVQKLAAASPELIARVKQASGQTQ